MHLLWFISRSASGGWRRCIVETLSASEERTEHSTESLAHGAVDEKVEWISDGDAAINEQRSSVACSVAEQVDVERVFDDDEQQQGRQRHFDEQEDSDDDDQHQCGSGRRFAGRTGHTARLTW